MSFQQTIVVGYLGGDPEMKYLQNGTAICNFPIAVTERWTHRDTNERQEDTTWYRVSVFGTQAENCNQYLNKGSQVMVVGNVKANAYMTRDTQEARASLDLRARNVRFLSRSNGNNKGAQSSGQGSYRKADAVEQGIGTVPISDDIPF